jgi:hypothetical protein
MGLQMRRVTWVERPEVDQFAARLGERLRVAVELDVRPGMAPEDDEGRDTVLRVIGPPVLARHLDALEWGDRSALLSAPFDVVSGDVLGAVVVSLVDLGAAFDGVLRPEWHLTLAQIRARYGVIPAVGRWVGNRRNR